MMEAVVGPSNCDAGIHTMKRLALAAAVMVYVAECAWAHPGHGMTDPETPAHYVIEPVHAVPVLILIAACALVAYLARFGRRG
jgi:hypothetical protein